MPSSAPGAARRAAGRTRKSCSAAVATVNSSAKRFRPLRGGSLPLCFRKPLERLSSIWREGELRCARGGGRERVLQACIADAGLPLPRVAAQVSDARARSRRGRGGANNLRARRSWRGGCASPRRARRRDELGEQHAVSFERRGDEERPRGRGRQPSDRRDRAQPAWAREGEEIELPRTGRCPRASATRPF